MNTEVEKDWLRNWKGDEQVLTKRKEYLLEAKDLAFIVFADPEYTIVCKKEIGKCVDVK